jgi:hypothetical protein
MEEFYSFMETKANFTDFGKDTDKEQAIKILEDEIYIAKTFERNLSSKNLKKVLTYLKDK